MCKRYSSENNRWRKIADLKEPRHSTTSVSISKQNCIYVLGGQDNNYDLNEKYNADTKYGHLSQMKIRF